MKILYVTKNRNLSGYYILKRLIKEEIPLEGVLIPSDLTIFDHIYLSHIARFLYKLYCKYQGADRCKVMHSEYLLAKRFNIPVYKIKTMNSNLFADLLNQIKPDLIFLGGGWPELIPEWVINIFPKSIYNTHPSLLPYYKGTSITRWQILKGTEYSGVTIHQVDNSFDAGDIIAQAKYKICPNETPQDLFKNLAEVASDLVADLFKKTDNLNNLNKTKMISQYALKDTDNYHPKWIWGWDKQRINLKSNSLIDIERFIRANNQESYKYIGPHILINKKLFIVRKSEICKLTGYKESYRMKEKLPINLDKCLIDENGIKIISVNKDLYLSLKLIQRWDRFLPIRRAKAPQEFFKLGASVVIEESPSNGL